MMAAVKGKNTRYELAIRKRLFAKGFRYRINDKKLPGKPDIVLPKYRVVIFINGCFWHYHGCRLSGVPKSNTEWWQKKLLETRQRDVKNIAALVSAGWHILIIWECSFRQPGMKQQAEFDRVTEIATNFILSGVGIFEISSDKRDSSSIRI